MKALVLNRYGGLDQVAFADSPKPKLKPDEILVQVHAVGLNPIDNMIPKGTFKPFLRFELPATLGSDLAGVVVEVGSRVTLRSSRPIWTSCKRPRSRWSDLRRGKR